MAEIEVCYTPNCPSPDLARITHLLERQGLVTRTREVRHAKKAAGDFPPEITLVIGALLGVAASRVGNAFIDALALSVAALAERVGLDTIHYTIIVEAGEDRPHALYRIPDGDDETLALSTLVEHARANRGKHFQRHWPH